MRGLPGRSVRHTQSPISAFGDKMQINLFNYPPDHGDQAAKAARIRDCCSMETDRCGRETAREKLQPGSPPGAVKIRVGSPGGCTMSKGTDSKKETKKKPAKTLKEKKAEKKSKKESKNSLI